MRRSHALGLIAAAALAACSAETTSKHHGSAKRHGSAPQIVNRVCEERFGETAKIEKVSALRPGFYEVMMRSFKGPRRAACTASDSGEIVDWVDL